MKVIQADGNTREVIAGCATMGLNIDVAIIDENDLFKLLKLDDIRLRLWLETLTTRFAYKPEKNENSAAIS